MVRITVEVCSVDKNAAEGGVGGLVVAVNGRAGKAYNDSLEREQELGCVC